MFTRRKFCDRECMARGFDGRELSDDPSKRTLHNRARRVKGDGPCEDCGAKVAVDVHHIDGDPTNNVQDNLARLCRPCHLKPAPQRRWPLGAAASG